MSQACSSFFEEASKQEREARRYFEEALKQEGETGRETRNAWKSQVVIVTDVSSGLLVVFDSGVSTGLTPESPVWDRFVWER